MDTSKMTIEPSSFFGEGYVLGNVGPTYTLWSVGKFDCRTEFHGGRPSPIEIAEMLEAGAAFIRKCIEAGHFTAARCIEANDIKVSVNFGAEPSCTKSSTEHV